MQFGVLRYPRLNKQGRTARVYTCRQPVNDQVHAALRDDRWIFVVRGQGVPIGNKVKALVTVLQFDPVFENTVVMPEMQQTGRPHARKHALVLTDRGIQIGNPEDEKSAGYYSFVPDKGIARNGLHHSY